MTARWEDDDGHAWPLTGDWCARDQNTRLAS